MSGMEILMAASTAMTVMGGISQADAMRESAAANARNAAAAAAGNKAMADYQAGQEQAAGQHAAEQSRRKAMLMLSRAQAVAAASGGGSLDENLAAGLIEQGEKDAGYNMYTANERAGSLRYKGDMGVYEANARGINEINSANSQADATIMSAFTKGAGSMAGMFAPSGGLTQSSAPVADARISYYGD